MLRRSTSLRVALALIGFLSAVVGWPWLTVLMILVLCILYRAYEAPFIGLVVDFLWSPAGPHLPLYTLGALIVLWLFEPLRSEFLK